jgi:hypothetical protein
VTQVCPKCLADLWIVLDQDAATVRFGRSGGLTIALLSPRCSHLGYRQLRTLCLRSGSDSLWRWASRDPFVIGRCGPRLWVGTAQEWGTSTLPAIADYRVLSGALRESQFVPAY